MRRKKTENKTENKTEKIDCKHQNLAEEMGRVFCKNCGEKING